MRKAESSGKGKGKKRGRSIFRLGSSIALVEELGGLGLVVVENVGEGSGLLGFAFGDAEEDFFESEGVFSEFDQFGAVVDECFGDATGVGSVGRHGDLDLTI